MISVAHIQEMVNGCLMQQLFLSFDNLRMSKERIYDLRPHIDFLLLVLVMNCVVCPYDRAAPVVVSCI